jgi:tRNA (uracil-5-)-methyltransferase
MATGDGSALFTRSDLREFFFRGLASAQERNERSGLIKNSSVVCDYMRQHAADAQADIPKFVPSASPLECTWGVFVKGVHSTLSEAETKQHGTWSLKHKNKNGVSARKDFVIKFDPASTEWYRLKQANKAKHDEATARLGPPGHCEVEKYDQLLAEKVESVLVKFQGCASKLQGPLPSPEVFASAPIHFRNRAEFRVWHEGERHFLAMFRDHKPVEVTKFDFGSRVMNVLMPLINKGINSSQKLGARLGYVYFLTTLKGDVMVTLIYTAVLDEEWTAEATALHTVLRDAAVAAQVGSGDSDARTCDRITVQIVGRAKKQRLLIPDGKATGIVTEKFEVGGRALLYKQQEESFTQPNAGMCNNMLAWAHGATSGSNGSIANSDLLELYCGCGNFCIALAHNFRRVLATEISAPSVALAKLNIEMNGVGNLKVRRSSFNGCGQSHMAILSFDSNLFFRPSCRFDSHQVARLSSEEYAQAHGRERVFDRLKREDIDLDDYRCTSTNTTQLHLMRRTLAGLLAGWRRC